MNKYSDGLNAIYAALGNGKRQIWAARVRQWVSHTADLTHLGVTDALSFVVNVHVFRWLIYIGDGTLTDTYATQSTSLPDTTSGGTNVFDLDSVSWLNYGSIYRVNGVDFALEDWEP